MWPTKLSNQSMERKKQTKKERKKEEEKEAMFIYFIIPAMKETLISKISEIKL
jgi:hypothetical protein